MTINTSHANITGGITNDILNILDITDSLYTNDTLILLIFMILVVS